MVAGWVEVVVLIAVKSRCDGVDAQDEDVFVQRSLMRDARVR
jgi:hypothetical protein